MFFRRIPGRLFIKMLAVPVNKIQSTGRSLFNLHNTFYKYKRVTISVCACLLVFVSTSFDKLYTI